MGYEYYYEALDICKDLNLDTDSIEHSKRVYNIFKECVNNREIFSYVKTDWGTPESVYLLGALLHDIGKAGIPLEFLNKPDKLTKDEFNIIKLHSDLWKFLSTKVNKSLDLFEQDYIVVGNMIQLHHENIDGTGYPLSLDGSNIPRYVRLLSIIDVYDALVSRRSYKEPISRADALNFILSEKGKKFDSSILSLLLKHGLLTNSDE